MIATLYGYQKLQFTGADGHRVSGYNLYVGFEESNVVGLKCQKFYVNDTVDIPEQAINQKVDLSFNYRGRIESVTEL